MTDEKLFSAGVVGSLPRPAYVRDLLMAQTSIDPDERERCLQAAIGHAVALQERAGLDVVTDGEYRRASYLGVIAELAHGFELGTNPQNGRPWTVVVDRLAPANTGFIAREVHFLKQITDRQIKATLPAPALLGERLWDPKRSAGAYSTRSQFVQACVPILRREVELLRDEGVAIVQIDDPHLCLFVDGGVRRMYDDADNAADFAVDMTNEVVGGVPNVRLAVHLCRRAGARARGEAKFEGGYDPIVTQLNRLQVHQLTMEFTAPGSGDTAIFTKLREDFQIGLGCVGTQPGKIDSIEIIVERVEQAMRYVAPQRISLNPDCGFAPGSAAQVGLDEVYVKLSNETEAARRLRDKYG